MPRTCPSRLRTALSARLLALLCGLLSITASFDAVVVNQVLDGSLYAEAEELSLTEQEEPGETGDDMLRPVSAPQVRRDRQERPLQGLAGSDAYPGRLPLSTIPRIRTRLHHSGCEHANRNGLGVPLLC